MTAPPREPFIPPMGQCLACGGWYATTAGHVCDQTTIAPDRRATPAPSAPVICHAPGDKCFGCDHYHGRAARCSYAPPAAQPADQPINEGRPAREQGPTTESADARLPDKGSAAASGAVAGARRSDDPTPSPAAQPAEPVLPCAIDGCKQPSLMPASEYCSLHSAIGTSPTGGEFAPQPAEPTATDDLVRKLRKVDVYEANVTLRLLAADLIERQAREIARWRNVTARADPDDCAAGIKELYGRWKDAEAELHKANIDSANMMAECSDLSVDVEKYRQEIAALRLAVKDDAQWAQENERLTRELDRVKAQLTSEITAALAERDAAIGAVNVLKNSLSACIAKRDAVLRQMQSFNAVVAERDAKIVSISTERDALKRELEITCAHLGLDNLLAGRDALRADAERYRFWRKFYDCRFALKLGPITESLRAAGYASNIKLSFMPSRPQVEVSKDYESLVDAAIDAARAKVR